MHKMRWVLVSCALLAACGGGGSGGDVVAVVPGGSGPTPTPTASPTTTPPPSTGGLNTGETKPSTDATFLSATMELVATGGTSQTNGIITGGATQDRVAFIDTPGFSGSYSSQIGYRLADTVNSIVFGPGQLTVDTTRPNGNGIVLFTNSSAGAQDYLALYQATTYSSSSKGSGYTSARYGGTAGWQRTVVEGSARRSRLDYFAYGTATPVALMPQSGVVRFTLLNAGNYATDDALWFLTMGSGNLITVDFGARTISGSLGLAGENFYRSQVGGIGSIPLNGSFSGNSLSQSFSFGNLNTSSSVPGRFRILFVGPNAEELIITYVAADGTQAAVGAAVGVRDPYVS